MCIIVVKPVNASLPSDEIFEACFENNDDGAGMMIAYNGKVHGNKGLMSYGAFQNQLNKYKEEYGDLKSHAMIFHFRIGTHGTNIPENTHPFPLDNSNNYSRFKETEWVADQGFAHNGIMYQFSSHADVQKYDVSDTMVFGRRVAAVLAEYFNIATSQTAQFILGKAANESSKFAYLDGDGNIATLGTFITDNGIMYSNSSYKKRAYTYSGGVNYYYGNGTPWWDYGKKTTSSSLLIEQKPSSTSKNKKKSLSIDEVKKRREKAEAMGLKMIGCKTTVFTDDPADDLDGVTLETFDFAYSLYEIYYWSNKENDWEPYADPFGGFALFNERTEEFYHNSMISRCDEDDYIEEVNVWR